MSPTRTAQLIADLKAWCKTTGTRQYKAAEMLNVSPQTFTEWVKGRHQPTGEQVLAILDLLNKPRGGKVK